MTYQILDSGNGKRLEQIGEYLLIRPYSQALWKARLPLKQWEQAHAEFKGMLEGGAGKWIFHRPVPRDFIFRYGAISFKCRLTDYGHTGFFFEQHENWKWLSKIVRPEGHYLNLFAYTGGSTFAIAGKAKVTHVDSSKSVIQWAKENAELSSIPSGSVRWITEDAFNFVKREVKRGNHYDGIILDPPAFGRGPQGEIWKLEKDFMPFLEVCKKLLTPKSHLVLLTAHSPGMNHYVLRHCLDDVFKEMGGEIFSGDMFLNEADSERTIPLGFYARWVK